MIRRYCDRCGNQITRNAVSQRIKRELYDAPGRIYGVEVMVAVNRVWNHGDLCEGCVVEVVNKGTELGGVEPHYTDGQDR